MKQIDVNRCSNDSLTMSEDHAGHDQLFRPDLFARHEHHSMWVYLMLSRQISGVPQSDGTKLIDPTGRIDNAHR